MTKEYEHKSDLDDEVEVPLDKDWKAPKEDELKVEVEEEETPEPEKEEPAKEEEEETPAPPRTDPAVLALRQQIEEMNRREAERDEQNRKSLSEREDQELNSKLAAARAKLKKAHEDGNTDAASEATEELTDIRVELKARQLTRQAQPEPRQQQYQQPANQLTPRWLQKNQWYGKPGHEEETFAARVIDAKMVNEGYDPNTEAYFDELSKRLKSKFRTIDPVGFKQQQKKDSAPPMAPARQAPKSSRPGVVRLTKGHFDLMRHVGLDPDNGEDRQTYARQIKDYGDPLETN